MIKDHWYKIKGEEQWHYYGKLEYYYNPVKKEFTIINKDGLTSIVKKVEFKDARRKVDEYEEKKSNRRVSNNSK